MVCNNYCKIWHVSILQINVELVLEFTHWKSKDFHSSFLVGSEQMKLIRCPFLKSQRCPVSQCGPFFLPPETCAVSPHYMPGIVLCYYEVSTAKLSSQNDRDFILKLLAAESILSIVRLTLVFSLAQAQGLCLWWPVHTGIHSAIHFQYRSPWE